MTAGGIRFGVWVNVSLKGFRMKTVDFAAAGMSTDVPRPLSGASVAVRNIFVPYRFVRNQGNNNGNSNNDSIGAGRIPGTTVVGDDADGSNANTAPGVVPDDGSAQKVETAQLRTPYL